MIRAINVSGFVKSFFSSLFFLFPDSVVFKYSKYHLQENGGSSPSEKTYILPWRATLVRTTHPYSNGTETYLLHSKRCPQ